MTEDYDRLLEVVAENPGATLEEITDLARDRSITSTSVPDLVSTAVSNDDLLKADGRYWVMRTGKYRWNRYDHPET
ncbi:hypothetical protein QA600_20170 [Natronococcus sp. A-GB1]|uniref:hypothetical protein n=1 Tax=Natronococcus sp. A-GB1 TaxID=3037648 RepID=UPI00241C18FD|nr:hypothetical protein [Natronococcus sp. A-GB1]MDG5761647.1 hypothetical protein [Natronococcus sp. A-GB1]